MTMEETIFKLVEAVNELNSYGDTKETVLLFQLIDRLCDTYKVDMPDEGVNLNIALDEKYGVDVLGIKKWII